MPEEEKKDEKGKPQSNLNKKEDAQKGDDKKKKEKKKPEGPRQTNVVAAELKEVAKKYVDKLIMDVEYFKERKKVFEKLAQLRSVDPAKYAKVIERLVELG